ncbi:hypothetical protein [Phytoactinopolyspora mesophila]|uniref:hypothetical protein n=1 Tax=Phytoactinopolyspora mesophila TaxID=2650750 RepID=UPI001390E9F3|nr:hypothetical protein [Phytoactinopolyspora mesophila]
MKFAQIIEYTTQQRDAVEELEREWMEGTEGVRPRSIGFLGVDRDRPHTYLAVVQWDSYEHAQRNNELPATHQFATKIAGLCDGPPIFRNLDVIDERVE